MPRLWIFFAICSTFGVAAQTGLSAQIAEGLAVLEAAGNGHVAAVATIRPKLKDPGLRDIADMILAADRLQDSHVRAGLARFEATGNNDPRRAIVAWATAATSAFAAGDYARSSMGADRWLQELSLIASSGSMSDAVNLKTTAAALAKLPPQKLLSRSSTSVPTTRDKAGLLRADASIDGHLQSSILDTGANVSTISASAAQRLGLHILESDASVASSTRSTVRVRVAYADSIQIGDARFSNVAFLVLDDAQLAIPIPGYRIDVILGFPLFRAMERVRFSEGGFQPFAPLTREPHVAALHFDGNNMFVAVTVNERTADLQLDSGSPATSLSAAFTARNPDLVTSLARQNSRRASAGGTSETTEAVLPAARITLGSCRAKLGALSISVGPAPPRTSDGMLGQDVMQQFSAYTIDFKRAELQLEGARNSC